MVGIQIAVDMRSSSPSYSESSHSDAELSQHQVGGRKRRKLSPSNDDDDDSDFQAAPVKPPPSSLSRVQAKKNGLVATPGVNSASAVLSGKEKSSFASLNVAPWLVASLSSMEIKHPTKIQQSCIPEILKERDCIGGSRTGTGKTVAFTGRCNS